MLDMKKYFYIVALLVLCMGGTSSSVQADVILGDSCASSPDGAIRRSSGTGASSVMYLLRCQNDVWVLAKPNPSCLDGLVSHYKLNETSGTAAADSWGSNNGTLVNGPVWQGSGGRFDGALDFDGSNDRLNIPHNTSLNFGTGDFSVTGWVKGSYALSGYPRLYEKMTGASLTGLYITTSGVTDDYPTCTVVTAGAYYGVGTSGYSVRDGEWHHIACVRASGQLRIYLDGVLRDSASSAETAANLNNTGAASIGYSRHWSADYYNGLIDDVRVYNRALSVSEIAEMYDGDGCF